MSMAYAIAVSDNIYAIKTHLFLGTEVMVKTLKDFGFTTPINDNVSLALGTSEVYLSELVQGYARFASLGKEVKPAYITKIVDSKGKVIYENKNDFKQKYSKESTFILSETMTNVFDNRLAINISTTGAQIANKLTRKYAGKSGTTNTDNWMIGYNADIVLGVWTGYDKKNSSKIQRSASSNTSGQISWKTISREGANAGMRCRKTSSASKSIRRQASSPRKTNIARTCISKPTIFPGTFLDKKGSPILI